MDVTGQFVSTTCPEALATLEHNVPSLLAGVGQREGGSKTVSEANSTNSTLAMQDFS